jgi:hypothetical protein
MGLIQTDRATQYAQPLRADGKSKMLENSAQNCLSNSNALVINVEYFMDLLTTRQRFSLIAKKIAP